MEPINNNVVTTDNNNGSCTITEPQADLLRIIANTPINNLLTQNPNLLLFPDDLTRYGDQIGEQCICQLQEYNKSIHTGNIMGFVGANGMSFTIRSRFSQTTKEDFFLHYLLLKVFCINVFDMQNTISKDPVFDFLLYLFPYYLNKALVQGVFKEYNRFRYNDCKARGTIDINRHIQKNTPFAGNVAYNTREYSLDNRITQLIRHTIEYVRVHPLGKFILNKDRETRENISKITAVTPTYNTFQRQKTIRENTRPVNHPYYSNYYILQKICLKILLHEKIKYGDDKDKIYGIIFDGAWLWEEYLDTLLRNSGYVHAKNKTKEHGIWLFEENKYIHYPDFYKDDIILDAKYKRLNDEKIDRDDMHQLVTYMHVQSASKGWLLCPGENEVKEGFRHIGKLNGNGGEIFIAYLNIPRNAENMSHFITRIQNEEKKFLNILKSKNC